MSMSEAMLREAYRDSGEVWLALRADGVDGSGTLDDPFNVSIEKIELSGSTATVHTRTPHGRSNGDYVVISGALIRGTLNNPLNGTYPITGALSDPRQFQFTVVPYSGWPVPTQQPSGEMWVDRYNSRQLLLVPGSITVTSLRTCTIQTTQPHQRKPGNNVKLSGITVANLPDPRFNDTFEVDAVTSPVELQFTLKADYQSSEPQPQGGGLGIPFQALGGVEGGTAGVTDENRVFHCWIGGSYHDSFMTQDNWVRNNHYHDVLVGPYQNLSGVTPTDTGIALQSLSIASGVATAVTVKPHGLVETVDEVEISGASIAGANATGIPVASTPNATTFTYPTPGISDGTATGGSYWLLPDRLQRLQSLSYEASGDGYLATAESLYSPHGLSKGDAVKVENARHQFSVSYPNSTAYNGSFTIEEVPSASTFRYRIAVNPGVDSGNALFACGYFGRIWQAKRLLYDRNIMELSGQYGDEGAPTGLTLGNALPNGLPRESPYTFRELLVQGNHVGYVDERYGALNTTNARAVTMSSVENALMDQNVIAPGYSRPFEFWSSGRVEARYNQRTDGTPAPAVESATGVSRDTMEEVIESVQLLALL